MGKSNIEKYESSVQNGMPVECYQFIHDASSYLYTSKRDDVSIPVVENGITRTLLFFAEYIVRNELEPGSQGNQSETVITVSKDNPIAKLYQGPPPEIPVRVKIFRLHALDYKKYDVVFYGQVTQASFDDSQCSLSVKLENWLSKEIPNGLYRYTCNNVVYDHNCRLNKDDWKVEVFLDKVIDLDVYSKDFAKFPDGYFNNGPMYFDGNIRLIAEHVGVICRLKYPFSLKPRNNVFVAPGCDLLYKTCLKKFNNSDNFTGFPYVAPTDSEKNPTGKGVYWMDSQVVRRDTNGFVGNISL